MSSLYDALLSLNKVEGAFENWAEYRRALSDRILARTASGGSCLIIGAGACNDLDLKRLAEHFSAVTLLDTDTRAMESALRRCPAGNVRLIKADLLGVKAEDYRALDEKMRAGLRAGAPGETLTELFLNETERLFLAARPDDLPKADTVVCCGVHSQLLAMFARMAGVYARYAEMDLEKIYRKISLFNARLQPVFNTRLFNAAGRELVIGLETGRLGVSGGIEGAEQALRDLSSRGFREDGTELVWPFDEAQGKRYTLRLFFTDKR